MSEKETVIEPIKTSQEVITHLNDNEDIYKKGSQFALGDAAHDFKTVQTTILNDRKPILLKGLPDADIQTNFTFLSEEDIVDSLVGGEKNAFQKMLYTVENNTSNNNAPITPITINTGDGKTNSYSVCSFNIKPIKAGNPLYANAEDASSGQDFAKNFITNTNLFGNTKECVFVIDFSQHHFLEKLAQGGSGDGIIYCVNTPELVNDPAGKPNSQDKTYFHPDDPAGVTLVPLIQTDANDMVYNSWNSLSTFKSYNDFFISKYNLSLSPIQQDYSSKSYSLYTNLGINTDNGDNKLSINNSKKENSITTILGHLKKISSTLTDKAFSDVANEKKVFEFNAKIQQKRGGDWFQVLCCLDIKNRTFTNLLDRTPAVIKKGSPVYFVTHDRIAVAYALLVGVNVIYMDYYGKIGVFKNNKDPTTAFDPVMAYNNLMSEYDKKKILL